MREILFRGRCNEVGKYKDHWIEGHDGEDEGRNEIFFSTKIGIVGYSCEPESIGQYTGLTDKNGKKIFEGDIVRYYHHKKSLVPVTDITPEEDHYGRDEESGLPLAYRTTKIIRYKGHVELDPILGMTINLKNRCEWWRNLNYEDDSINSDRLEVIGNIHDNPELLEVSE